MSHHSPSASDAMSRRARPAAFAGLRSLPLGIVAAALLVFVCLVTGVATGVEAVTCSSIAASRVVAVSTAAALKSALSAAQPGDRIDLAAGTYSGNFVISKSGTASKPIVVCGPRSAVLKGSSTSSGYGFHINAANFVQLVGFTVTNSQKGIMVDSSSNCKLSELLVHTIGHEAVHFRKNSKNNRLERSEIRATGRIKADYGEGVYIGSAKSNLVGDASDFNQIVGNRIGPDVTAEAIDIKEYSRGGLIADNIFDGKGMSGANYADSWIDVKGNGYLIQRNTGTGSLKDGMQTHDEVTGWGSYNVFDANVLNVNGPGRGIEVAKNTINIVRCNNKVSGAALGLTNLKACGDQGQTLGTKPTSPAANWPSFTATVQRGDAATTAASAEPAVAASTSTEPTSEIAASAAPAPTTAAREPTRAVRMPTLTR